LKLNLLRNKIFKDYNFKKFVNEEILQLLGLFGVEVVFLSKFVEGAQL